MYIHIPYHTWNLTEVPYSRHHYPTEASPRRGFTHVWPPANHTPTPYTSPLPTSAGGPPGTLGRRPYTCITPTWASAFCARTRWGQQFPTSPYLVEVTYAKLLWPEFIAATKSIAKPPTHIRRRPPRNAWPEAIYVYNPDVGERILREDSLGTEATTGQYLAEVTCMTLKNASYSKIL
ncbi:hypothetical protein [uncultured Muribaculum sp.]|uniref:hypothetical protein n=1 Tax=uncultured Muribaculum sp. TaxID=1918613 RepID=UPI00266ED199|nr:hypothetical protein [uncultured Muribaculum sp.]